MTSIRIQRHRVTSLADGSELAFHVHELDGASSGPVVGICAAIHGNEPTGTLIVQRVLDEMSTREFAGKLLLLPVANPPAFATNRRHSPLDDLNLNRLFPGNPNGWVSEQLAHVITKEFLTRTDVLIDLHSGGDRPTVDYIYIKNTEPLSRAFGSRVLYRPDPNKSGTMFTGTSNSVTESRGIKTVTVELGGGLIDQTDYIKRGFQGILNILRSLEMLPEDPEPPPPQIVVNQIDTIRPQTGGLLVTSAPQLGDAIAQGAILGRVIDPHTFAELEIIRNPTTDGIMILSHLTTNIVQPGDYGYMVGTSS